MTSVVFQTQQASVAYDPWDAPYFGAPVYLAYPGFVARDAGSAPERSNGAAPPAPATEERRPSETVTPVAATSVSAAAAPCAETRRRGWLARLFGGR